jgi:hypothetical protein
MEIRDRTKGTTNLVFGLMGTVCLFAILAAKLIRFRGHKPPSLVIDVAPSLLGPAGLLFLLMSSTGRLSRLSLLQMTLLVAVISFALEFAQLIPRPGPLARILYTFDPHDLAAIALSLGVAYGVSVLILRRSPGTAGRR